MNMGLLLKARHKTNYLQLSSFATHGFNSAERQLIYLDQNCKDEEGSVVVGWERRPQSDLKAKRLVKVAQQAVLLMSLCWWCWWYFWWGRLIWCPLVICWCWWISIRHWRGAPKHPDKSLNFFDTPIPDSSFFLDFSKQFASHFSSAKTPTWGIVYEGWGHSRQTIVASWAPVDYHELSSIG